MTAPGGVHFCGSIQLPEDQQDSTEEEVLKTISAALPNRLPRLPDGEVAVRSTFCGWQAPAFLKTPWIAADFTLQMVGMKPGDYLPGKIEDIELGEVQYDDYAIESYHTFAKLKKSGAIHPATRFQVSLPTPLNPVTYHVRQPYREHVEPIYEILLLKALDKIQAQIPHEELAIQWDCPIEVLFLNGLTFPFTPHFECTIDSVADRLQKLAAAVSQDVQLGFHLCYGDFENRHMMEPKDMSLMVELANALLARVQRLVNWIHMPVPVDRKDEAYFAALSDLRSQRHPELEIYLGLVHANDLEGTKERISMAKTMVPGLKFGVATECGLGRMPKSDIASVLEISNAVSTSVL